MNKLLATLLFFAAINLPASAQNENNIWNFGLSLRMDFNTGVPAVATQPGLSFSSQYGSASVCNSAGNLLFYTDSRSIFDRNGFQMPNANFAGNNGLAPQQFLGTAQGVVIVPFYNDTNKYYVFTLYGDLANPSPPSLGQITHYSTLLSYSVVDMTLNFSFGNIPAGQKRIPMASNLGDKMIAVKGAGCYTWLIVHHVSTKEFLAYKIDATGIHPPVSSLSGSLPDFPYRYCQGAMKASPDSKQLAVCNYWKNSQINPAIGDSVKACLELFHFDNATGIVSNPALLDNYDLVLTPGNHKQINIYSCAFSGNSKMLYESIRLFDSSRVVQWNTGLLPNLPAAVASATILQTADSVYVPGSPNTDASYYDLRLGPDKRVYVSRYARKFIERINLPDLAGTACDYQKYQVSIGSASFDPVRKDLGSDVISSRISKGASIDSALCAAGSIVLNAPPTATGYLWQSGSTSPSLTFTAPGTIWVAYTLGGCMLTDTFHVAVVPLSVSLGNDTVLCEGQITTLAPIAGSAAGYTYLWQDGSTGAQLSVTNAGAYWVQVLKDGCKASDTVQVHVANTSLLLGADRSICDDEKVTLSPLGVAVIPGTQYLWQDGSTNMTMIPTASGAYSLQVSQGSCISSDTVEITLMSCGCDVFIPNAFSPNGDGRNDVFGPRVTCKNANPSYHFEVFNRWGQQVFESFRPGQGWDGTFNGQLVEVGTYMYMMTLGEVNRQRTYKGDVLVLR